MGGTHVSLKFLLLANQMPGSVPSRFCLYVLWDTWLIQEVPERNVLVSFLYFNHFIYRSITLFP